MEEMNLHDLGVGFPGLTPEVGIGFAQAGAVCLEDVGHQPGIPLALTGDVQHSLQLSWPTVTDQMRRCWNDQQEATEYGAVGIAVLLLKRFHRYSAIERSFKGTGFDYWLGENDDLLFQKKARLEVSGIIRGNASQVENRVVSKLKQTDVSDGQLPAYVAVVEFGNPLAKVVRKKEPKK